MSVSVGVAGRSEQFDRERFVGGAVERSRDCNLCAVADRLRDHREVLQRVATRIGIASVVGCVVRRGSVGDVVAGRL